MANKRALIVDDSRSARAFLARLLERHGLEADGVGSASEAYAYLRRQLPDVLFLDHLMPEADGFEVLRVLRRDGRTRAIPVLMYTSQQGDEYLAQARSLGALGVLPKQLRAADLTAALAQAGIRAEYGATVVPGMATTVVDALGRKSSQATTIVGLEETVVSGLHPVQASTAGAPANAAAAAARPAMAPPAPPAARVPAAARAPAAESVEPELRSLLESLVREQGLALRQQVAQLIAQQGERMAAELRAIRREMGALASQPARSDRLVDEHHGSTVAAGSAAATLAAAAAAALEERVAMPRARLARRPPSLVRVAAWAALVLLVAGTLLGVAWLLRPGLFAGTAARVATPAVAHERRALPPSPTEGASEPLAAAPAKAPAAIPQATAEPEVPAAAPAAQP